MKRRLLCTICGGPVAGSQFVDLAHPGQAGMVVTIHVIDKHWDVVERIHATTHDGGARMALVQELRQEMA